METGKVWDHEEKEKCFYLTYEEWKLFKYGEYYVSDNRFLPYLWGMETLIGVRSNSSIYPFLPYLWGMETESVIVNLRLPIWVFTLPMRNGNTGGEIQLVNGITVFTLPMRNGNLILLKTRLWDTIRFYLTYEEWKLDTVENKTVRHNSFLPYLWGMET